MPSIDIAHTPVLQVLPLALDAANRRHQVIATNLANASNPDWRAQKLTFEDSLQAALAGPQVTPAALKSVQAKVVDDSANGGMDAQVLQLSRNVLHYQALTKAVSAELELLSKAASDGRR